MITYEVSKSVVFYTSFSQTNSTFEKDIGKQGLLLMISGRLTPQIGGSSNITELALWGD